MHHITYIEKNVTSPCSENFVVWHDIGRNEIKQGAAVGKGRQMFMRWFCNVHNVLVPLKYNILQDLWWVIAGNVLKEIDAVGGFKEERDAA